MGAFLLGNCFFDSDREEENFFLNFSSLVENVHSMIEQAPKSTDEVKLESMVGRCLTDVPGIENAGHALVYFCLKILHHMDDNEILESITDGGNDLGVDFIAIDESRSSPTAIIVATRYFESEKKRNQPFPPLELDKIRRFLSHLTSENVDLRKTCNPKSEERILLLRNLMVDQIVPLEFWFVSNAVDPDQSQIEALEQDLYNQGIQVRHFHRPQILSLVASDSSSGPERTLRVNPKASSLVRNMGPLGIVGLISADSLCNALESPLFPDNADPSLFARNVRGFLGLFGEVNREIVKSTRGNASSLFWAKNNGLTMVAREWNIANLSISGMIEVRGLSILNGAQTCSALFDQWRGLRAVGESLEDVSVPFKMILTNDDELIHTLTITANTQNRIRPRDIMANDPLQVELERKLSKRGVVYVRRADELLPDYNLPRMTSTLAGQLLLSIRDEPHKAKTQTEEIFGGLHRQLFTNVEISQLLLAYNTYNECVRVAERIRQGMIDLGDNTRIVFVSYASFHVVAVVLHILKGSPKTDLESAVIAAYTYIGERISERRHSPYEYFRSPHKTEELLSPFKQSDLFEAIDVQSILEKYKQYSNPMLPSA